MRRKLVFDNGAKVSCIKVFKLFESDPLPSLAINVMTESPITSMVATGGVIWSVWLCVQYWDNIIHVQEFEKRILSNRAAVTGTNACTLLV